MPLRQTLRDISHSINNRVAVFLAGSGFLRKHVPPTADNSAALNEMEEAAEGLRDNARLLERITRKRESPVNIQLPVGAKKNG